MTEPYTELDGVVSFKALLGYLNFSEGKPDPRFQKQINDAYWFLAERGEPRPWLALYEWLRDRLRSLSTEESGPFRDPTQAQALLFLVFERVLPAYRRHHADLLFHLADSDLFQPFFLVRVMEAVLARGGPWSEEERVITGALRQLNDYVGHRPIAILESRPQGEPYAHERLRPIPLFIRGAGVAWGRYHDLVARALEILAAADPAILAEADFELELLDELALDPRAYDHGHPANRRPNYVFGEWDPHHLDNQGRYRRYVARQVTLDALLGRLEHAGGLERNQLLFEAAAVFAGTMLMAAGMSGSGPGAHDSSVTLAKLTPRIARYRDAFYAGLLEKVPEAHGARLRQECETTRQPFGGARQHLNQYLAGQRATQLQQRHLALLFADMGYPEASRRQAARIPAASIRFLSDMQCHLATGQRHAERGELKEAAQILPLVEDLLRRGIACGALPDPWNILGFQGLFPLLHAQEDSIRDPRIDDLVLIVERTFDLYARILSEAAAAGNNSLVTALKPEMRRLAAWWDRFASVEVSGIRRVHGGEALTSAEHVASAMARWHERGEAAGDLAFWREHLAGFQSPKAFGLVIQALLAKRDYRAAMALLVNWLGHAEHVPLEDSSYSFHLLALQWMLAATSSQAGAPAGIGAVGLKLAAKFLDYLEANAEEYWQVPALDVDRREGANEAEREGLYSAAYENVTYRDSAADEQEGAVADGESRRPDFDLESDADHLNKRLRFLTTVAQLCQIAARRHAHAASTTDPQVEQERAGAGKVLGSWLATAQANQQRLCGFLDALEDHTIPEPSGSHESMVEYDRRRLLKEQLLYTAIATSLQHDLAVSGLRAACLAGTCYEGQSAGGTPVRAPAAPTLHHKGGGSQAPAWEPLSIQLQQALLRGDREGARATLPAFLELFRDEPLLFTALADGGHPRQILRTRLAQSLLQSLAANLPRLGLVRQTHHLLKTALAMEQAHEAPGHEVTQFNQLFQNAFQGVVDILAESAPSWGAAFTRWVRRHSFTVTTVEAYAYSYFGETQAGGGDWAPPPGDRELVFLLQAMLGRFLGLWVEHGKTLRLSALEPVRDEKEWQKLRDFIRRYGGDLFDAKFLTLANLRGILHRGVGAYLDYLRDNPDPLHPVRLLEDLDSGGDRAEAERHLQRILQALVENYEEYKDYNTTTTQSDYGENLYVLLDFLLLKASYDRHAWQSRPLLMVHEVFVQRGQLPAAKLWVEAYAAILQEWADQHWQRLAALEQAHGIHLRTVADRIQERFVKPLALDRACALLEPAMKEAILPQFGGGKGGGGQPAFARLEEELQALAATPTGVGLEVPEWLRRLEHEVQRVRAKGTALAVLAEDLPARLPKKPLSFADLEQQLQDWSQVRE